MSKSRDYVPALDSRPADRRERPRNLAPRSLAVAGLRWFRGASLPSSAGVWLTLIAGLTLIVYLPMLPDWFQTDDFDFLRAGRDVGPLRFVKEVFDFRDYDRYDDYLTFIEADDIGLPYVMYRPLTFISLEAMYVAFGENPVGYHVVSLLVHFFNTYLVWRIASRLLTAQPGPYIAALLFALHPAYVPAVAWIANIGSPLAVMAALSSLLLFMNCLRDDRVHAVSYAGSVSAFALSVFFHQETISWVAAFLVFAPLFLRRSTDGSSSLGMWPLLLPYGFIAVASYILQTWIEAHTPALAGVFHIGPHMLTQFKYLAIAALYPQGGGGALGLVLSPVILVAVLGSVLALTLIARRSPRERLLAIAVVLWFVASLAPILVADDYYVVGVLFRKLYAVGPSLSILLVMLGTYLFALFPRPLDLRVKAAATILLTAALVGVMFQATENRRAVSASGAKSERFVQALRDAHPSLPEGTTLVITGSPAPTLFGADIHLVKAVKAFYRDVDVVMISGSAAPILQNTLEQIRLQKIVVFHYDPDSG